MRDDAESWNRRAAGALFLLGALFAAAVGVATSRYGPGYNPDAVTYLATARHLAGGEGFVSHWGRYARWPPLFPLLMAGAERLGLRAMAAARWINALAGGATVAVAGELLRRAVRTRALRVLGGGAAVTALPLLGAAVKASSEALFALLVILFVWSAAAYLRRAAPGPLAAMTLAAALACLQRYAGVALLPCGAAVVFFRAHLAGAASRRPEHALGGRLGRLVLFGAGAALPLGLWLARNLLLTGTLTGTRVAATPPGLGASLHALAYALAGWLLPPVGPLWARVLVIVGAGALLLFAARRYGRAPEKAPEEKGATRERLAPASVRAAGLLCVVYLAFIAATGALGFSDVPNRRLVMPAFAPALLPVFYALDGTYRRFASAGQYGMRRALVGACVVWWGYAALLAAAYVGTRADLGGGGYNTTAWQTSATARWFRAHAPGAPVRSNDPHALYFLTGRPQPRSRARSDGFLVACFDDPKRARLRPRRLVGEVASWGPGVSAEAIETPALPDRRPPPRDCLAPPLVPEGARVTNVATLADGAVYRVE